MAPADRMAMIRGMVGSLAARLEQSPRDADGWMKLIRSRASLDEKDKAAEALEKALAIFEGEPGEHDRIAALGRQLGIAN
jgi:cytochrome c-type biogenesis protein CcmH